MGCRTLIGATEPDGAYTARWLHWGDHPDELVPVLRRIWRDTFNADTTKMLTCLLSRAWSSLSAEPTSRRTDLPAVAGVGYAAPRNAEPGLWRGRVTGERGADLEWMYLIDPHTGQVSVYEATVHDRWLRHSRHHLDPNTTPVLHNGTAPIREWVTPAGFAACHPTLAGFGLPLVCTALAALHPDRPAVLAPSDGAASHVWLVAPSHALMLTPASAQPSAGTVVLPRPLGGSWSADTPVPVVSSRDVAAVCTRLGAGYARLLNRASRPPA